MDFEVVRAIALLCAGVIGIVVGLDRGVLSAGRGRPGCAIAALAGFSLLFLPLTCAEDISPPESLLFALPLIAGVGGLLASKWYDRRSSIHRTSAMIPTDMPLAVRDDATMAVGVHETRALTPVFSYDEYPDAERALIERRNRRTRTHQWSNDPDLQLMLRECETNSENYYSYVTFAIESLPPGPVQEIDVFALETDGKVIRNGTIRSKVAFQVGGQYAVRFSLMHAQLDIAFWWAQIRRGPSVTIPRTRGIDADGGPDRPFGWSEADLARGLRVGYRGPVVFNRKSKYAHHPDCLNLGQWVGGNEVPMPSFEDAEQRFFPVFICLKCL